MVWPGLLILVLSGPALEPGGPLALLGADPSDFPQVGLYVDPGEGRAPTQSHILESGKRTPVTSVEPAGPWTLMLVLDNGPAARAREPDVRERIARLAARLPSGARVGAVVAGDSLRVLPPTLNWEERVQEGLTLSCSRARLLDGLVLAAHELQGRKGPRGVAVIRAGADGASQVDPECARLWAAKAGAPIWDIAVSGEPDPAITAIESASGAHALAASGDAASGDALDSLVRMLTRSLRVTYESTAAATGRWVEVELPGTGAGQPPLRGGYLCPPGAHAVEIAPRIRCPAPLEALPVLFYDERGRDFHAWTLAGRAVRLPAGRHRCVVATRPRVERVIEVGEEASQPVVAALGALTVTLPSSLAREVDYRVTSERTHAPVGVARSGEPTPLPPGSYGVQLLDAATFQRAAIGVAAGRRVNLDLSDWAAVTVELDDARGQPAAYAVELEREGETYAGVTNSPLLVPPGEWTAVVQTRPALALGGVTAAAGEARALRLPPLGALRVELIGSDGQPAREAWITGRTEEPAGAASGVTGAPTDLPPGDYALRVLTSPPTTLSATVRSGEESVASAGRLAALTLGLEGHDSGPRAVKYSLIDSETGERIASGVTGRPLEIRPGEYDLDVWTHPHLLLRSVAVAEGGDAHIALGALGALTLDAPPQVRIGAYRESDEGETPAVTLDGGETIEVLPGAYETRALEPSGFEYTMRIVVGGGEVSRLHIAAEDLPDASEEDANP